MDNLVCCIECFELVDYEDAVYSTTQSGLKKNDEAKCDSMVCLECYVKKIIHQ